MKKIISMLAAGLLAGNTMNAEITEPRIYEGYEITGISSNAKWAVSYDSGNFNAIIINLETQQQWQYGPAFGSELQYTIGYGHCVSDDGIVVGGTAGVNLTEETPAYWEDGQWHQLLTNPGDYAASPNAITPDGQRITGYLSLSGMSLDDVLMVVPVVWTRQTDGTYGMYERLPYPVTDFSGRVPQYIIIDDISADGKTLAGDIVDYSGYINQPIVYNQDADGNWTYTIPQPQLVKPDNYTFPPYPGEAPTEPDIAHYMTDADAAKYQAELEAYWSREMPNEFDYMTDDEYDAYIEAYYAYLEDNEANPYPDINDFMTAEEKAEYDKAVADYWGASAPDPKKYVTAEEYAKYQEDKKAYEARLREWAVKYSEFEDVFEALITDPSLPTFEMNSAAISPNGRYYMMTASVVVEDKTSAYGYNLQYAPYLFDLENNTYQLLDKGVKGVRGNQVMDDGTVIGGTPATDITRDAVISAGAGAPFETLLDYLQRNNPDTFEWCIENMTHDFPIFYYDNKGNEQVRYEEKCMLGTPVCTPDLQVFATWIFNTWENTSPYDYYSYVLPGLATDSAPAASITGRTNIVLDREGHLTVTGDAAAVEIYDINGRIVYSTKGATDGASTGLSSGLYMIRVTDSHGVTTTRKVRN